MLHSRRAGQAHFELGVALAGLGDVRAAGQELRQAVAHLQAGLGPEAPATRRAQAQRDRLAAPG